MDDDGDLLVDLDDPDCNDPSDGSEEPPPPLPACSNGLDDDGDGLVDHPADPGCANAEDDTETDPALACDDGADDDGDERVDFRIDGSGDPGCSGPLAPREDPQCQNGIDDDADGRIDFDGGASANGGPPLAPPDPECKTPYRDQEKASCGLGGELLLALLALRALLGRRRRSAALHRGSGAPASLPKKRRSSSAT